MHNITIIYNPDNDEKACEDGMLRKEADAVILLAQSGDFTAETSTWTLVDWIRAQACEAGAPEKISVHYKDQVWKVNEYGAMPGVPFNIPINAAFIASEKIIRLALAKCKQKSEERVDLGMQLRAQIEDMIAGSKSVFQICQILHTSIPGITIDDSKEIVMRIIKLQQERATEAGYPQFTSKNITLEP